MNRVYNFSPGPAMLPEPVLRRAQAELLDWQGSGMSVMEVSHRGTAFIEFAAQSEKTLRELLGVPANYKVLFLQGGATLQFAAVPLNLAPADAVVDYVVTGNWGEKAVSEAARYVRVNVAAKPASSLRFQIRALGTYRQMQRICTTPPMKPCTASSFTAFPRCRARHSSPTCPRHCCPDPLM
jgi:phosphoserine aminotransferase